VNDGELNSGQYGAESSLKSIAARGSMPYAELIRGPYSFGAQMEQHGFLCSPSPSNPHPKVPFFRGGYNTGRHGRDAAPLAGLQIETYSRGVRDTPQSREKFAKALADTLAVYLPMHVGVPLESPMVVEPKVALAPARQPADGPNERYTTPVGRRRVFRHLKLRRAGW